MGYIYKIYCNDSNVKDFYIGSTNVSILKDRITHHKCLFNKGTNSLIYNTIRNNGGWDNWSYEIIQEITNNKYDIKDIENEYALIYKPTMNSNKPYNTLTKSEYHIQYKKDMGRIKCDCGTEYNAITKARHNKSKKHQNYLKLIP